MQPGCWFIEKAGHREEERGGQNVRDRFSTFLLGPGSHRSGVELIWKDAGLDELGLRKQVDIFPTGKGWGPCRSRSKKDEPHHHNAVV